MNTQFMKITTYIFFGVMFFSSHRDFENFQKTEGDSKLDKNEMAKFIHKCVIKIGIILFFIMLNILAIAVEVSK